MKKFFGNFLVKPSAVPNRTYQAWENVELPKYFLKLHSNFSVISYQSGCPNWTICSLSGPIEIIGMGTLR